MEEEINKLTTKKAKTTKSPAGGNGSGLNRVKTANSPTALDDMIINKFNNGWDANRIAALYMLQKSYVEQIINSK